MKMRVYLLFLFSMLGLFACTNSAKRSAGALVDTTAAAPPKLNSKKLTGNFWTDIYGVNRNVDKDSINGKPVNFYLDNPKVASIAKDFYLGKFRPTDNDSTATLLALVTEKDSTIRPYYRWVLNTTIDIADGALGEYPGEPALHYAIAYPQEFFAYMDKDPSGKRYSAWLDIISYSGLFKYDYQHPDKIKGKLLMDLESNCGSCSTEIYLRIDKMADEIVASAKAQ